MEVKFAKRRVRMFVAVACLFAAIVVNAVGYCLYPDKLSYFFLALALFFVSLMLIPKKEVRERG
jgi:hypothetical protein